MNEKNLMGENLSKRQQMAEAESFFDPSSHLPPDIRRCDGSLPPLAIGG